MNPALGEYPDVTFEEVRGSLKLSYPSTIVVVDVGSTFDPQALAVKLGFVHRSDIAMTYPRVHNSTQH